MATEMKAVGTMDAVSLVEELERIIKPPIKEYEDLEDRARRIESCATKNLEAMLNVKLADQQILAPVLQRSHLWIYEADRMYRVCLQARVSPENYFKDREALLGLKEEERVRLDVLDRNLRDQPISDQERPILDEVLQKMPSDIRIPHDNMAGAPVSQAIAVLGRIVDQLKVKMKENEASTPSNTKTGCLRNWKWNCAIL
jgi:hypothetical protein